jgi:hypothetical protein
MVNPMIFGLLRALENDPFKKAKCILASYLMVNTVMMTHARYTYLMKWVSSGELKFEKHIR